MRYSGSKTYVARNDLKTAVNAAIIEAPLGLHDDAVRRLRDWHLGEARR